MLKDVHPSEVLPLTTDEHINMELLHQSCHKSHFSRVNLELEERLSQSSFSRVNLEEERLSLLMASSHTKWSFQHPTTYRCTNFNHFL
uniref:Uncharacterized protein n=1 Tax=Arundo donax TaxID=35708 RepID=A0A0A9A3I4_ARUDO